MWIKISSALNLKTGNSPLFNPYYIPFMASVPFMLQPETCVPTDVISLPTADESTEQALRLQERLTSFNFDLVPIVGDGNCFFRAVSYYLETLTNEDYYSDLAKKIGDVTDPLHLRNLVCTEWSEHSDEYAGFLTSSTVAEEVRKFRTPGYFMGELGDTMPLAMSNVLGIPIIIITSTLCTPFICLNPRQNVFPAIIYLAYHQYGAGHYDAVKCKPCVNMANTTTDRDAKDKSTKCNCGVNMKSTNVPHCIPIKTKYTEVIKCPCVLQNRACSTDCRCKECSNTFGRRPIIPRKRDRRTHCWQGISANSYKYVPQSEETVNKGNITLPEFYVIYEIDQNLPEENDDTVFELFCACMHELEKTGNAMHIDREIAVISSIRAIIAKAIYEFENQCHRHIYATHSKNLQTRSCNS